MKRVSTIRSWSTTLRYIFVMGAWIVVPNLQVVWAQFAQSQFPVSTAPAKELSNSLASQPALPAQATLGVPRSDQSMSSKIPLERLPNQPSPPVVNALCASPDGRFLAVAGDDHVIRIIDMVNREVIQHLTGHTDWIQSLVFAADSQTLFSGGNDGQVLRWNHVDNNQSSEVVKVPFAIRSLSISSHRSLLAIGGFSDTVNVWDLQGSQWKHRLSCDTGDKRCVQFSPEGDKLLCGGRDGSIHIWDTTTGDELLHKKLHSSRITNVSFSTDGNAVSSVSQDRRLVRYDLVKQEVRMDRELAKTKLMSLCLINDQLVAVAGSDNSIRLYDSVIDDVVAKLEGHVGTVSVMGTCGNLLVSGSFDTTIRIWNLQAEVTEQSERSMPVGLAPLDVDKRTQVR